MGFTRDSHPFVHILICSHHAVILRCLFSLSIKIRTPPHSPRAKSTILVRQSLALSQPCILHRCLASFWFPSSCRTPNFPRTGQVIRPVMLFLVSWIHINYAFTRPSGYLRHHSRHSHGISSYSLHCRRTPRSKARRPITSSFLMPSDFSPVHYLLLSVDHDPCRKALGFNPFLRSPVPHPPYSSPCSQMDVGGVPGSTGPGCVAAYFSRQCRLHPWHSYLWGDELDSSEFIS